MDGLPQHLVALFADTRLAYTNARDHADIQPLLAEVGYDPVRLDALLAEVAAAEVEAGAQEDAEDAAEDATGAAGIRYRAVRKAYLRHVKLARTLFEPGTPGYRKLKLRGERPDARALLLSQADEFYRVLAQEPALLAMTTAEFRLDQAAVDAQRAAIGAVRERLAARAIADGEAQDSTQSRDGLAGAVEKDWGVFRRRARVALEDRPQLLEVLGITAPS